jgi:putative transposase
MCKGYLISERRGCRVTRLNRGTYRYRGHKNPWTALRMRIRVTEANQAWSLDFMADQLTDGRQFRVLTILDVFTRESLAVEVGPSLKGTDVVEVLNQIRARRGTPKMLFCDNGSEFSSQIMDLWMYQNGVRIDFSRPGKPTDNAFIETFNGTLRAEYLDAHWFSTLAEAKERIEAWRKEYNESRPHRALGERTPNEFANGIAASLDSIGVQTAENSP